jgi:hypothetical protein
MKEMRGEETVYTVPHAIYHPSPELPHILYKSV